MMKRIVLSVLLLVWTAPIAAAERAPVESFGPLSETEAKVAILEEGSELAATDLQARSECSRPGVGIATFSWKSAQENFSEQRIDITEYREGFATGRYLATRGLAAARETATMEAPIPGIRYYWRVLRQTPVGWVPSRVERFSGPTCPDDRPRGEAENGRPE